MTIATTRKPLTVGSLFAGIGGIDLGLQRAGMVIDWQVEIDDYATRVLERHWPNVRRWGDVTTFLSDSDCGRFASEREQKTEEPSVTDGCGCKESSYRSWGVDLIAAGFPCTDISRCGTGDGIDGQQSRLFFEVIRVARQLRPKYLLLENVAAIRGRGLDRVLGEMASIGYDAEWNCIPASAVGAPHIRDRIFIVAIRKRILADANSKRLQRRVSEVVPKRTAQRIVGSSGSLENFRQKSKRSWRNTGPELRRVSNGVPRRVDRLRALGNAVVPQVAEYVGREIVKHYENLELEL